ncbi:4-hydroxy-tetrahydrodipicolinate synthase [Flexivirga endophytica]|uniref:4-hydroxy-tetrahydrodipicolinate synthase n=1 Tax=Flexivirga endophytica TaxID=1849103 RepID=A0A916SUP0_9MICO|nr:4-hydroxy-tetrahydrodipicolinate synthase [Flexivirga endophytica]GGB17134.1 4-hydroxy-tetrahydrodipicolinate synthase [Flexivirga endophytica]GHB38457.1 4-hydroxy-tetrahydrodipicolinate synthase [Flexivirga endophytica]
MTHPSGNPFGTMITAMVTPMHDDGSLDLDGAQKLATHLVDQGNDGILVNGTTGESATTTDQENNDLVRAVAEAVGDRAVVMAGVGTNDTAHSVAAARNMAAAGAQAALIVTPYYNKPPQAGVLEHYRTVAAATDLPAMAYDIPGRTATALAPDTIRALAEVPNIKALKDAKGDLAMSAPLILETGLLWYSGDDALNLPWLALGATGMVSTVGNVASAKLVALLKAVTAADLPAARAINHELAPLVAAVMNVTQGTIQAKAALRLMGVIDSDFCRLPLVPAPEEHRAILRDALTTQGLM